MLETLEKLDKLIYDLFS